MKTNLQKIVSISGQPGLFLYISQASAGVIVESLSTKKRGIFGMSARLTSLSDISVYTTDEEVPLHKILVKMQEVLKDNAAPEAKSNPDVLRKFFEEVLPEYDRDRFYVSHMKKVVDWYNTLREFASLDFELPEEPAGEEAKEKE
ncbi:MAG: hypothetical protein A2X18_00565 [Bacteroidetes bacterium GWF2_40_14]|nr:MAG: hypothetical protein A2X18_00565 [Bacteroidetes bacterium GWF2_40_14]